VLFDPLSSERRSGLALGALQIRELSEAESRKGASLALWGARTTRRGAVFAELRQVFGVRAFEGSTVVLDVSEYMLDAGLRLGPLRFGSGFGVLPIGFAWSQGELILDLLCPQASLFVSTRLGDASLGLRARTQYLFRVLGRENAFVNGLTLEVSLGARGRRD
jgi:hypothetical protein